MFLAGWCGGLTARRPEPGRQGNYNDRTHWVLLVHRLHVLATDRKCVCEKRFHDDLNGGQPNFAPARAALLWGENPIAWIGSRPAQHQARTLRAEDVSSKAKVRRIALRRRADSNDASKGTEQIRSAVDYLDPR